MDCERDSMSGGPRNSGANKNSQRDRCNCPIIGRDSAVVVTAVAAPCGSDHHLNMYATVPPVLAQRLAADRFMDYREAGPPIDILIRFERLLI